MSKLLRSPVALMALTIFIDFTGFGLVIPLLPFWAEHLGANATVVGLIVTVYALAQFLFTPVLGSLSDRYGRRPVIIVSLVIEAVAFALTALAGSLPMLFVARFIGGLGASNIGSAQAVVADVTPVEQRARGMGLIGAAIGLGFVIGPALGGALSPLGAMLPFWVALCVALVNAVLVASFLPETRKKQEIQAQQPLKRRQAVAGIVLNGWQTLLHYPVVAALVLVNLLFTVAFTAMETTFPLFTQQVFGWAAMQNGYVFTYVGIVIVIMQGGLVGQLVKRFGERSLMLAGLIMMATGLALLAWSTQLALLLVALGILSAGDGAVTPIISTLLSFASPENAQGKTLGLAQGVGGLGRILGPMIAGSLFTFVGAGAPFLVGAGLIVIAMLVSLPTLSRMHQPQRKTAEMITVLPERAIEERVRAASRH